MAEKILIVDDDLDSLKLIGLMLQRQGYEVSAANSGAQALEIVSQGQPSLVILDVMMPDLNGYEVARRMRSDPQTMDIPIIMFTAKGTVDDKVAGFEAGADDYLTKPIHPAELASRVKVLLSRSTTRPGAGPGELGQIASFIGVKGGVGTTTLALNSAVAMAQVLDEGTVALAEMRPGRGTVGLILGFSRPQGLGNLLSKTPNEITTHVIEGELVPHQTGISLLMAASSPDPREVRFSPDTAEMLVKKLAGTVNYLVLDLGDGLTEENKRIAAISNQVVVGLEPHRVAVAQAKQMLKELLDLGLGPLRTNVVLVSRTPSSLQMSWQSVQQTLQKELLAIISPAPELAYQALENQVPMIQLQPDSITAGQFHKLGEDLMQLMVPVTERLSG